MKKVYIAQTKNNGKGIFASKDLKKGETIFVWKGKIVDGFYLPKNFTYANGADWNNWFSIGNNKYINPTKSNPGRYINHSCNPNSGVKAIRKMVAIRNIKKDTQITMDYSTVEEDQNWKMKCFCKEKNCRKILKSVHFLPKKTFSKLKSVIPKYFQKLRD
ncbi:MAG: SET domain-containing protein-lysine N-methyltransferase [archaeon]|nr:SET domain-containing protein-lysine N-methyltransferase [archaeon]